MDSKQLDDNENSEGSGGLPIALYANNMRKTSEGKLTYYGKVTYRSTLTMQNIASRATTYEPTLSADTILAAWKAVNEAILKSVEDGFIADVGLGTFYAKVNGTFDSENEAFSPEKHSIDLGFRVSKRVQEILSKIKAVIRQGNRSKPEITSVHDLVSKSGTTLTPGGFLEIIGKFISVSGEDESVGLYFENIDDESKSVKVTEEEIGQNTSNRLALVIPPLTSGKYKIKIVTQFTRTKSMLKEPRSSAHDEVFTVK